MRGNIEMCSAWCPECERQVKAERNSAVWGCGDLLMVLFTFGLWVPLRIVLTSGSRRWRCCYCGEKV